MADIRISPTFRCAECGAKLYEVRARADSYMHNLWCPRCDRDLIDAAEMRGALETAIGNKTTDDRCPGCGCEPGDGLTANCYHPDGCGYYREEEQ